MIKDYSISGIDEVVEIKPCPFCGYPAKDSKEAMGIDGQYTTCSNKDCACHSYLFLVSDWNIRLKKNSKSVDI